MFVQAIFFTFELFHFVSGENISINPFKWDAVGRNLFSLFVQGFGYFLIVICIEYNFWFNKLFFKYQYVLRQRPNTVSVCRYYGTWIRVNHYLSNINT